MAKSFQQTYNSGPFLPQKYLKNFSMELTAENVNAVLMDCLFTEDEINQAGDHPEFITAEGVKLRVGLHPERLAAHKQAISEMADQLPAVFKDGMSFLNACMRGDGRQWGEHSNIDELICLGVATGKISFPF